MRASRKWFDAELFRVTQAFRPAFPVLWKARVEQTFRSALPVGYEDATAPQGRNMLAQDAAAGGVLGTLQERSESRRDGRLLGRASALCVTVYILLLTAIACATA